MGQVSDWSTTAAGNATVAGLEWTADTERNQVAPQMREMMAQLKRSFDEIGGLPAIVADGATNDAAAINAALLANKKVVLPAKDIYIGSTPLVLQNGTQLVGAGDGNTRIITDQDVHMVVAAPGGIYRPIIRDIQFWSKVPVANVAGPTFTATTTAGSSIITAVSTTAGLFKGARIAGTGIPPNTFIRAIIGSSIRLGDLTGAFVNATASGTGVSMATTYRRGPTKHHIYLNNAGWTRIQDCYFFNEILDSDYSPENLGGIWFDRDPLSQYFLNEVRGNWINRGEIRMGTSDSSIDNNHVWGIGMDAAIRLNAPGIAVRGNNASNGQIAAIVVEATAKEVFGGLNHNIVANNIDSGGLWQCGYGILMIKPTNVAVAGNRINICAKGGVRLQDASGVAITGNQFNNNNLDGLSFSDVENAGVAFAPTNVTVSGNVFSQDNAKAPDIGWAIREVNGGFAPSLCGYTGNVIGKSANYLSPAIVLARPSTDPEQSIVMGNAGGSAERVVGGTFVPALVGSTTPGTVAYSVRTGSFGISGKRVSIQLDLTTTGLGGMAGNVSITGLPAAAFATASRASLTLGLFGGVTLTAGYTQVAAIIDAGAGSIRLVKSGSGVAPADVLASELGAATLLSIGGSYEAA